MIKNIVFDISNVLAPFRFKEFLAEKGFDAAMIKRIIKASKAEECVFIDDTEENVLSAKKLGFAGIVFTGYDDAVAGLDEIIGSR